MIETSNETELLGAARGGDAAAFGRLVQPHLTKVRGVVRRMVGHPEEVDDLVQQTLLNAHLGLGTFRGDSAVGTWLCAIGARLALDHLRTRKRWRERAQSVFAAACLESEALGTEVGAALNDPSFTYSVNEHIAYCFTCIGRTLDPEEHAALVLRDVLDLSTEQAAQALGVSRSVLKHHLASGRNRMQGSYEGLCALVSKQGACWQCSGLRQAAPEGSRGPEVPACLDWAERLRRIREAALDGGKAAPLHDGVFRHPHEQEEAGRGDPSATTDCGHPDTED